MSGKSVVVIGAGLGGLAAAVSCAQNNCRVTILEKQPRPGGYSVSFVRKGYTFDVALHAVPAGGPGGYFRGLLEGLGIGGDVAFMKYSRPYRIQVGDRRLDVPMEIDAFFDACNGYFPNEKVGLARFRAYLSRHAPVYSNLLLGIGDRPAAIARFIPKIPSFLGLTTQSTEAFLSGFFRDPLLKAFVFQPAVFLALPMKRLPAINFIMMFSLLVGSGMYTIAGGGQALTDAFVKRFAGLGGELRCGEEAASIEMKNGRAVAVVTTAGNRYPADAVIANVNINRLVGGLVDKRFFPRTFQSHLSALRPSMPILQLHAGLDCSCETLGLDCNITVGFKNSGLDVLIEKQDNAVYPELISLVVPDLSKPRPVASAVCSAGTTPWISLPESQYKEAKAGMIEHLLKRLDVLYPGFSSHCAVVDLSTPRTFHRYTDNPGGAIVGFDCSIGMHSPMRAISRLPVKNIHCANSWTDLFGGYMQTIKCGIRATARTMKS
jgi:phytoene dehydrogenase-like protein